MKEIIKIDEVMLKKQQLKKYLEKIASGHNVQEKVEKETYPVPPMLEDYEIIKKVYKTLNEHIKLGIEIHPAGEWLLDNIYIIEETVKMIQKELTIKKYINLQGIQNGEYAGYARIYVLAAYIVGYTENKIEKDSLIEYLESYQAKKTLSMDEIWNIGMFLDIAIIHNIRDICEKIYISQMQKYKAENIIERLVEKKEKNNLKYGKTIKLKKIVKDESKPFVEHLSYKLKKYGKKGIAYINILEETMEMHGSSVSDVIKKEHFSMAIQKVLIGNSIISIKKIQRINFLEIFEKINGVEDILRKDLIYVKMDSNTKEIYRNKIKEIAKKTKTSEIYITKKIIELVEKNKKSNKEINKKNHIGYYLIDKGQKEIYEELKYKKEIQTNKQKVETYLWTILLGTCILSGGVAYCIYSKIANIYLSILVFLIILIPSSEIVIKTIQYILSKIVKPKAIPKIDMSSGIDKENATMVVIPTILSSKEKVSELMRKLEIYYIANKSDNMYFTLLGDCSESNKKEEEHDLEVIKRGKEEIKILNKKYPSQIPIFSFIYRNRTWNKSENKYLGWERKRGMLNQLNEYLLGHEKNVFRENTIKEIPKIKYIITLDADTDLILNSAFDLIGAMAHPLNRPVIDKEKNIVIDGYAIIQPRVGINLDICFKTRFTKIFAGAGGIDSYSNAISDIYQDNFGEGIFTGKGIYDLAVFSQVLNKRFPENTVLSHDLLEGSYLRCGLATDIMLMDGYPLKYNSFMNRLTRWIRGDWQIIGWLSKKRNLNTLSRFKILDNLRRSLLEVSIIFGSIYLIMLNLIYKIPICMYISFLTISILIPFILEILNIIINKKEGEQKQKTFTPKIIGIKAETLRGIITLINIPYKAAVSIVAAVKTLYRLQIKKHLLEWMTSEESEKQAKQTISSYFNQMHVNIFLGVIFLALGLFIQNIYAIIISIFFILAPIIMWYISLEIKEKQSMEELNIEENKYIKEVAKKTWGFFEKYLTKENNYLIPDNYQENRVEKIVKRTSSTNIGLSLLSVISAYDMGFIKLENAYGYIKNILETIQSLAKWNGHLYNWYNIETKVPLIPRYISTVDSGNFVGYMYVVKTFLEEIINKEIEEKSEEIDIIIKNIEEIIRKTEFIHLYSEENQLFSVGFDIEENRLTDSYYDLLASEARQASLVAIAKKEITSKHWKMLSRTLTNVGKYKGLVSWAGTAFEYLMPNINIPKYKGSLLDESAKFLIMSQIEYAKELNIPWGISESAFNLKDLNGNYQYKAFGLPWIGLKRGLSDEMVVSPYATILAINDNSTDAINNLKELEKMGSNNKYGFYEAVDFTPERTGKGKPFALVKTYMAHHQGLILLSINNFLNNKILQRRFVQNPEIAAITILLQETMPDTAIITKEIKEPAEKIKHKNYDGYITSVYGKMDETQIAGNIIANDKYTLAQNQKGVTVSKYKDIQINRYKQTANNPQGIITAFKNIKNKQVWTTNYELNNDENYEIRFSPDNSVQKIVNGNIKTKITSLLALNDPVEMRKIEIKNTGNEEEIIEVTTYFEPVLSKCEEDFAHPVFNNMFLVLEYDEKINGIIAKRKKRSENQKEIYLTTKLCTDTCVIGELEYEIDGEKFFGRGNNNIPSAILLSAPFSKKNGLIVEPVIALKQTVKIMPGETSNMLFTISVNEDKEQSILNLEKYSKIDNFNNILELSKAKIEEESRYLGIRGTDILNYQKLMTNIVFKNILNKIQKNKIIKNKQKVYQKSELWKYGISGDSPIILVKIRNANDKYLLQEVLKAYEYLKVKNIETELVIIDEEKYSYENYVKDEIESCIINSQKGYLKNIKNGIFILSRPETPEEDLELLECSSLITIDSQKGGLSNNIKEIEEEYLGNIREIGDEEKGLVFEQDTTEDLDILENSNLKFKNDYGGFLEEEYFIRIKKDDKLPTVWSNILTNKNFGTVVTENMGGYTWHKNSRLNRISAWENKPLSDIPSEVIYIKDSKTKKTWTLNANVKPDDKIYNVIYGLGYAKYIHNSNNIYQELEVFVPRTDSCKIQILKLKNETPNKKKLHLYYFVKNVLGEDEIKTNTNIDLKLYKENNILIANNIFKEDEFNSNAYTTSSEKISSYTGNKEFFLGKEGLSNPNGIQKIKLNNENSLGNNNCICYEIEVELESFGTKEISIILGAEDNVVDAKNVAYKYSKIQNCKQELQLVKEYWKNKTNRIEVKTPNEAINIMLNAFVNYQTLACRMIAKTGYYQSGGAIGYRDQLQDALSLKYIDAQLLKNQIIKHSKKQFIQGDVLHWWHEQSNKGIRTRFSDDLLWLAYAVIDYVEFTGDITILEEKTKYIQGEELEVNQDEKYDKFEETKVEETIYMHCKRAIDKTLDFGKNGLPKIGSGDWNDGFSTVGNKGEGESVWLGFFLYNILNNFIPYMKNKETAEEILKYEEIKLKLKQALNTNGWDERWYKRAFMDNGDILGSMSNDECRIDSIAQSWSVISKAGDNDKKYISMESLENHLIDKEHGIIKLLDPPFEKGKLEPGYIKAYTPGVRENGGQYTHAAIWTVIAFAMLGFTEKATEIFNMINPIQHSRTKEEAKKYKVEPYVIPADVYGKDNLTGRGGWTWYTGSSSWYYQAGIKYILGLDIKNNRLDINPCVPKNWEEYTIKYRYRSNIYIITVKQIKKIIQNTNSNITENKKRIFVNNTEVFGPIKLEDNNKVVNVRFEIYID